MSDPTKLAEATAAAVIAENSTGVPASVLVAQWAIESAWGQYSPEHNCFGIKSYTGEYGRQLLHSTEWFTGPELAYFLSSEAGRTATVKNPNTPANKDGRREYTVQDWFATFPTLAACFERRAQLFDLGRYKPITEKFRQDGDLTAFVEAFASIYATDPSYSETVLKIAGQQNVKLALGAARRGGPIDV